MTRAIQRRTFFKTLALAAPALFSRFSLAREEKSLKQTHIYKVADGCEIKADVYRTSDGVVRPVILWIHGGALIMGDRGGIDRRLREKLLNAGYAIVSIDYRLAPETKLAAILEDVQDAYQWLRVKGPELFHVATDKIAVMGGSAGGYLTLTTGFRVSPRPTALVSFWGYGDITSAWYSRPDPFYCRMPLVPKEEAYKAVGSRVLSETSGRNQRGRFYLYCRQQGIWPNEVAGIDPETQDKAFDPFCPIRNVNSKYPPTLLIHGTNDTDVPYEQSAVLDRELNRQKVEHELITVEGGGHGLAGVKPAVISETHDRVLEFLNRHMR